MAKRFPQATALLEDLVDAIDKNKPKKFQDVLARSVDVNAQLNGFSGPHSPFQRALHANNYGMAVELLDAGAKLEEKDLNLVWAVGTGRTDIVRRFIEEGANVHVKTLGGTPIQAAASGGHAEIIRVLVDHGADIDAAASIFGTPLQRAVERNHTDAALALIEVGSTLEAKWGKKTLVQIARSNKNKVLVDALKAAESQPRKPPPLKSPAPTTPTQVASSKTRKAKLKAPSAAARDPDLPDWVPDFTARAKRRAYLDAVADLEKRCGTPRQPMRNVAGGFKFHLHSARSKSFNFDAVHAVQLKRGAYVFWPAAGDRDEVAVLPTTDQFEVLLAMGTNGVNSGLGPEDVVAWLRKLEREQPFTITAAGWDFLDGTFASKIKDPKGLAERMLDFCTDLDDAREVEAQLRKSPARLFFWWD
jgi:hypothetical protein